MSPVAAGGVTQMEVDVFKLSRYLEEAGHPCDGDAANTLRALKLQLTAAQTEADRLRVDADRYVWLRTNADYVMISWDDAHSLEGPIFFDDALIDAAIHAAKTEQERGE